nr:MAG TPA: hypothetical protein [Caudoviricetes sp.]
MTLLSVGCIINLYLYQTDIIQRYRLIRRK